jgi:hypothetical protein
MEATAEGDMQTVGKKGDEDVRLCCLLFPHVTVRQTMLCAKPRGLSAFPVIFGAKFFSLCPHRRKPALEDIYDCVADLGRRKDGSIYKPTPAVDLIFGAHDHFIGITIHVDEALGFLNLLHQLVDGHCF